MLLRVTMVHAEIAAAAHRLGHAARPLTGLTVTDIAHRFGARRAALLHHDIGIQVEERHQSAEARHA